MKEIRVLVFIALTCLLEVGCDVVDVPIEPVVVVEIDSSSLSLFPELDSANLNVQTRKILVEEFTGHKCPNCPSNTRKLLNKQKNNDPEIIVIAYHTGNFAKVEDEPFDSDYNTSYGTELDESFSIGGAGYPSALVNRAEFDEVANYTNVFPTHGVWKEPIDIMLENNDNLVVLGVEATFEIDSNAYYVTVGAQAMKDLTGEYRLSVFYIQDSVVSAQIDITASPKEVLDYVHKHVFRDVVNNEAGLAGEIFISDGLATDEWQSWQRKFELPSYMFDDPMNCTFVAVLKDAATSEVIQVEEVHPNVPEE